MTVLEYPGASSRRRFDPAIEDAYAARKARLGASVPAEAKEGDEGDDSAALQRAAIDITASFARLSAWESSGDVPDPDAVRAAYEAALADDEAKAGATADDEDLGDEAIVDVTGGKGYAQVYAVMTPPGGVVGALVAAGADLIPRRAVFRYGSWIYAGEVC